LLERATPRGATAAVIAVELLRLGIPNDGEEIATDSAARRFHQAEGRVDRDRGVNRGTACLQDVDPDLARQRVRGCSHAVLRDDRASGCKRQTHDAVTAANGGHVFILSD
jgi:hypothetical protein